MMYHSLVHGAIYDVKFVAEPTEHTIRSIGQGVVIEHIFKFNSPKHLKKANHEILKLVWVNITKGILSAKGKFGKLFLSSVRS